MPRKQKTTEQLPEKPVVRRGRKKAADLNVAMQEADTQKPENEYMANKSVIIGRNIRTERKQRNFSVENLADYLGLSVSYIGLLERGARCPSLKIVYKLCELFGTTPDTLLFERKIEESIRRMFVADDKSSGGKFKVTAINGLLPSMTESELDFILATIKNVRRLREEQ